jgi:hypothetical protein
LSLYSLAGKGGLHTGQALASHTLRIIAALPPP